MSLLLYLAKVLAASAILSGYYWFFLRNKRFHQYNRFYVLAALTLPVIVPFIKIPLLYQPASPLNQVVYQAVEVLTVKYNEPEAQAVPVSNLANWLTPENCLVAVYVLAALVLLFLFTRSLVYIHRLSRRYTPEQVGTFTFYNTAEPGTPFSFFNRLFWNRELDFNSREGQQIFRHELFHIQQKHSLDVLLADIMTIVCWCNPFFHLLKKELKAIHEFLADQYAISDNNRYDYAALLVKQVISSRYPSIGHPFFQNHIKRRINMITQQQPGKNNYLRRILILPVAVFIFGAIALSAQRFPAVYNAMGNNSHADSFITVVIDAGHGGIDAGARSNNGVLEKDLTLQISRKIAALAKDYPVRVLLTRNDDQLPDNADNTMAGLRNRTLLAQKNKAAAFVSIHIGASGTPSTQGFEVYIPNSQKAPVEASRKLGASIIESIGQVYQGTPTLRQQKEKGIWVLDDNTCPAVLIECGYLTNEQDLAFIQQEKNQEAIARKVLEGIVNYATQKITLLQQRAGGDTLSLDRFSTMFMALQKTKGNLHFKSVTKGTYLQIVIENHGTYYIPNKEVEEYNRFHNHKELNWWTWKPPFDGC